MHGNTELILTLTGGLAAALVLGYVTQRLGFSPIVGYLLAGIAVGPNTPGFVANHDLAEQLAEVGVILLMFGVGLHFHFKELLAVRKIAVPGAIGQSVVATVLGALLAAVLGWGWSAGIVFGLAISVASTVVLTRVLVDNNDLHTPTGHIAVGWLVVEDLFTVVVLVVLPAIFGDKDATAVRIVFAVFWTTVKIGVLVVLTIVLGGRVIPWLLERVASTHSRELFTLTVLVVALGIAAGSAVFFGVSMALGAFLAGMVVGRSEFSLRAAAEALPMRDAFAVLFFVSVGMLFDPRDLWEHFGATAATLAIIMIGKPLAALVIVLGLRRPAPVAFAVAAALAQIGEFSFMLAAMGKSLGVLPATAVNAIVAASILSIAVNPLIYRSTDRVSAWFVRRFQRPAPTVIAGTREPPANPDYHRAIVVGYGPVGQTLSRLLRDNEIEPTIVELNLDTVTRVREAGFPVVYGDAAHSDTLRAAGIAEARSLILGASGIRDPELLIRTAKQLNPSIQVLARAAYLRESPPLREAGADRVFSGEGEVALAMTEFVLRELGALPEQMERERYRVRSRLFGPNRQDPPR
jgi:CPA2 family monovalent cation:H+ antiporter-2